MTLALTQYCHENIRSEHKHIIDRARSHRGASDPEARNHEARLEKVLISLFILVNRSVVQVPELAYYQATETHCRRCLVQVTQILTPCLHVRAVMAISDHPSPVSPLSCPAPVSPNQRPSWGVTGQSEASLRRPQTRCSASITPGQLVTVCQTILKCPLTLTPHNSDLRDIGSTQLRFERH